MKPTIEIETWTPAKAKKEMEEQERRLAKGDYRNRVLNELTVRRYANDMKQGHWLVNNQGIGFDGEGNLLDGRHRLWAVVRASVAVDILTFRGLEGKTNGSGVVVNPIDTLDCGRVRSVGQQFGIDGISNPQHVASSIRALGMLALYPAREKFGAVPARGILHYYRDEVDKYINVLVNKKRVRSAFLAPILMYAKIKPRNAAQFHRDFTSLVGLEEGSPAIALDIYCRTHAGHAGYEELRNALCAGSLAIYHFDNGTKINALRHSSIGLEWLQKEAKSDVDKILKLIGREVEE